MRFWIFVSLFFIASQSEAGPSGEVVDLNAAIEEGLKSTKETSRAMRESERTAKEEEESKPEGKRRIDISYISPTSSTDDTPIEEPKRAAATDEKIIADDQERLFKEMEPEPREEKEEPN